MSTKYTKATPYKPQRKLHLSEGNTKIGKILNTNLLAGDDDINGRVTITGSCAGCCSTCKDVCYARSAYRYDNVIVANADNTLFAREDLDLYMDVLEQLIKERKTFKFHRWHSSGEIMSREYLAGMIRVAQNTPAVKHYVYTKRYEWASEVDLPENMQILLSPPFTCKTKKQVMEWSKEHNKKDLPLFIYDDGGDPEIGAMQHCPAVDKKGHKTGVTCDKCQRCINGMTTAVYAH